MLYLVKASYDDLNKTHLKRIPLMFLCVILFSISRSGSCIQETAWELTIDESSFSYGYSVRQTRDNGFLISGISRSESGEDQVSLHKVTGNGELEWIKTIPETNADHGVYMQQTREGGFILGSYTGNQNNENQGIIVIKTDESGDMEWVKSYPELYSNHGVSLDQTKDGGYILTGYQFSQDNNEEMVLVKIGSTGDEEWRKLFGGGGLDKGVSVQQTEDGGFIVAGNTDPQGSGLFDVFLVKTDSEGTIEWDQTVGGEYVDYCMSVQQTMDQGYIVTGYSNSFGEGQFDVFLCRLEKTGKVQWETTFGAGGSEKGMYGVETDAGSFVVVGYTDSFGNGMYDGYVLEANHKGELIWNTTFGGSHNEYGLFIQQSSDGGYAFTGLTESNTDKEAAVYLGYLPPMEDITDSSPIPGSPFRSVLLGVTVLVYLLRVKNEG